MDNVTDEVNPEDLTLMVSDVPAVQRQEVVRIQNEYVLRNDLAGRVVMIATKMGKAIERLQRVQRWEGGLTALAMDYLATASCQALYGEMLRLQVEDDRNEGETSNGNSAQSGGGRKRERKGR